MFNTLTKPLICFIFLMVFALLSISAQEARNNNCRISKLLPEMSAPLAIDPALPEDYAMKPLNSKEFGLYHGVVWGKSNELNAILENSEKVIHTFIVVSYSMNISQIGPQSFSGEDVFEEELKKAGYKDIVTRKLSWGSYPVLAMEATDSKSERKCYSAWVGLNSEAMKRGEGQTGTESGMVLVFNLFYPRLLKEPNEEQLTMWNHFLEESKQLPKREFNQVHGICVGEDQTLYEKGCIRLKARVIRTSSGELEAIVEPLSAHTEFELAHIEITEESSEGKPLAKVYGEATYSHGATTEIVDVILPVVIRPCIY